MKYHYRVLAKECSRHNIWLYMASFRFLKDAKLFAARLKGRYYPDTQIVKDEVI